MNNNIDDWLSSLGFNDSSSPSENITSVVPVQPVPSQQPEQPEPPQASQLLSQEDFNDILIENGFQGHTVEEGASREDEGEGGIIAESPNYNPDSETYDENGGEGRDLDAEEDTDWDTLIQAGAIQAVQDVNENYPAHSPDENLIPTNSPTLLLNDATSRFSGAEWYNEIQKARIILAGCGGIGSWTVLQLARMSPEALFMYDDDIVETANMSGQLYCRGDVGMAKVDAMYNMIENYTTMENVFAIDTKFTSECEAGDIMICGFDNMEARRTFFTSWNNHVMSKPEEERAKCLYLDGRLSVDTLQVFCITGDNDWAMAEYADKYLFSDAEAEHTVCSLKQTTYLACMIGSFIVNLFTNFIANLLTKTF